MKKTTSTSTYDTTLLEALRHATLCSADSSEESENMKKTEYEKALTAAGFDLKKIYPVTDKKGREYHKTSAPIQVYRRDIMDVYERLYEYFYPSSSTTFSEVYQEWIEFYATLVDQGHAQPSTLRRHKQFYNAHIQDTWLDKATICDLKRSDIKRFYREITAGRLLTKDALGNVMVLVNSVFSYASTDLDLDVISTYHLNIKDLSLKEVSHDDDVYTRAEHDALMGIAWDKLGTSVYARAVSLMGRLDIRIGELCALKWSNVDLNRCTIKIENQLIWYGSEYVIREPKGNAKYSRRVLPLTPQAIEVLKLQRKMSPFSDFIFVRDDGSGLPIKEKNFNKALERYCYQAGIKYRSSHKLRFFAVTEGLESGQSLETMRTMSGHSTTRMTQHYDRRHLHHAAVSSEDWAKIVDIPASYHQKQNIKKAEVSSIANFR